MDFNASPLDDFLQQKLQLSRHCCSSLCLQCCHEVVTTLQLYFLLNCIEIYLNMIAIVATFTSKLISSRFVATLLL